MHKHIKNILITWLFLLSVGAFASSEISLNTTVNGALTEDSYIDADGNRAEYYTFTLSEAKNIVLKIDTTFTGKIKLKNDSDETLKSTFLSPDDTEEFSKYLEAGNYSIKVRNNAINDFGTFTLTYKENQPKHTQPISLGETKNVQLTTDSYLDAEGKRAEYYSFTLDSAQDIVFTYEDPKSSGTGGDGSASVMILQNSQGHNMTGAIEGVASFSRYLEAGEYRIKIAYEHLGNFLLTIKTNTKHIQPISLGQTIHGMITKNSYLGSDNYSKEYYTFTLTKDKDIIIQTPSTWGVSIDLKDSQGKSILSDNKKFFVKHLNAGTYTIGVLSSNYTNNFTLSFNETETQFININSTLSNTMSEQDSKSEGYNKRYTFTLPTDSWVNISTHSNDFTATLSSIYNQKGYSVSDYNNITPNKKNISTHLKAGTYSFFIGAQNGYGDFSVNVQKYTQKTIGFNTEESQKWSKDSIFSNHWQLSDYIIDLSDFYSFEVNIPMDIVIELKSKIDDFNVIRHRLWFTKNNRDIKSYKCQTHDSSTGTSTICSVHLAKGDYTIRPEIVYEDDIPCEDPIKRLSRDFTLSVHEKGITPNAWLIPAVYTPMLLN